MRRRRLGGLQHVVQAGERAGADRRAGHQAEQFAAVRYAVLQRRAPRVVERFWQRRLLLVTENIEYFNVHCT